MPEGRIMQALLATLHGRDRLSYCAQGQCVLAKGALAGRGKLLRSRLDGECVIYCVLPRLRPRVCSFSI
jgi:hypothetical protein